MKYLFIGIAAFLLICVAFMGLFTYLANHYRDLQSRKAIRRIDENSPYKRQKPKPSRRGDDFLSRDKVAEKKTKEEQEMGVARYNPHEQELNTPQEESRIVGVAKPVGFWSNFVMKQKIGFIVALGGLAGSKKGYWENYIKAQAASQSKEQSRGK
jgi:hypothetical protein